MTEPFYLYCIVFFTPLLMISLGVIYVFIKDWAWDMTEWMLRYVNPQRTPEWERSATQRGWVLLVGGIIFLLFLISKLI